MYPDFKDFECTTKLEIVNLDAFRLESIRTGRGFRVKSNYKNIKKELKNPDGIYSNKFGRTLADVDEYGNRYKCDCGKTISRINEGTTCPYCHTKVKYVDDDFGFNGFLVLDDYYIIHPKMFETLKRFFGAETLNNIIKYNDDKDINGYSNLINPNRTKDEPFFGIGMIAFKERFMEIINYYRNKNKNKIKYYDDIINNIDKVFTQTIVVFTTLLRATKNDPNILKYEPSNELYMIMSSLVYNINQTGSKVYKAIKPKAELLYDLQCKQEEMYDMILVLLSGKRGKLRGVFGGRYNFTARVVIVPEPKLRVDQVIMPYQSMIELEKQRILNVLEKVHGSAALANSIYEDSIRVKNPEIIAIIRQLIKDDSTGQGIPVLVNRNPTLSYGSIQQMFVVDVCESYTLKMPLQILPYFNADFDGDVLNVHRIQSKVFYEHAYQVFNPRNAMYINMNDGLVSTSILPYKDILINSNTLLYEYRQGYSQEQLDNIKRFKERHCA